ncbi:transmembrane adaptor Erv26 [Phyllosticta citriasiana]|uniref:transmembrane adaptor Erv26 n=1 Tax=Phyllosticta citriasiana TaxID=595635 RepID=UPI0030FDA9D5
MWILPLVGYLGVVLGFGFLTLAIASGLYYLSELVEEHTVFAKKLLTRMIYAVISIQLLLWLVDKFPFSLSLLSVLSHVIYAQNLRRFPIVKLSDPLFILSCVLVIVNHYFWFRHFSAPPPRKKDYYSYYNTMNDSDMPSFTEIASYFGLCVWLVPFSLFVSLSAGENVLPSMGSEYATGEGSSFASPGQELGRAKGPANVGMAKALVDGVRNYVEESGEALGVWMGDRSKRF